MIKKLSLLGVCLLLLLVACQPKGIKIGGPFCH
jgi:hypothetical protein